jgi:hypothetical protein
MDVPAFELNVEAIQNMAQEGRAPIGPQRIAHHLIASPINIEVGNTTANGELRSVAHLYRRDDLREHRGCSGYKECWEYQSEKLPMN